MSRRRLLLASALFAPLLAAQPAAADTEYWGWFETRIPLVQALPGTGQPVALRLLSDYRWGGRYPGLGWSFLRVGPLWTLKPGLMVGTHFTSIAVQNAPGVFIQEYRGEIEPNFFGRLGDFTWNDRNRLEYRWRAADQHFRYRNQLRVNWAPPGQRWQPFIWDEPMIELNAQGLAQNRIELGVGYQFTEALRFDVGGMVRSRTTAFGAPWDHDLVLNTYLYFAPAAVGGAGGTPVGGPAPAFGPPPTGE